MHFPLYCVLGCYEFAVATYSRPVFYFAINIDVPEIRTLPRVFGVFNSYPAKSFNKIIKLLILSVVEGYKITVKSVTSIFSSSPITPKPQHVH